MNFTSPKNKSKARFYVPNFVIHKDSIDKPLINRFSYLSRLFGILNSPFFRITNFAAFTLHTLLLTITRLLERLFANIVGLAKVIWTFDLKIWHNLFTFGVYLQFKLWLMTKIPKLRQSLKLAASMYLIICCLVITAVLKVISITTKPQAVSASFLNKFLNNYTYQNLNAHPNTPKIIALASTGKEVKDLFRISKHTVKDGETIETIAENYGLNVDTIIFNNKLEKDKPLPKELILPWQNSYIYFAKDEIEIKKLAEIYGMDEKEIYGQNEDILVNETAKFPKDSIVLLPTTDFEKIKKAEATEKIKETQGIASAEKAKAVEKLIQNNKSAGSSTFASTVSADQRSAGFIWPTKGVIMRCLQPGHNGCDIADSSGPPIFAVQDGIIKDVYIFTVYGYGQAVVIDHGNGLTTLYAHMSEIYVVPGQAVTQGTALGRMGCTGMCTGTHLHFEVRQGGSVQDPLSYLP